MEEEQNWRCKHCGGKFICKEFYDEEGVPGFECEDCENTILGTDFDEDEMVKITPNNKN
jgi:hypothetical protein